MNAQTYLIQRRAERINKRIFQIKALVRECPCLSPRTDAWIERLGRDVENMNLALRRSAMTLCVKCACCEEHCLCTSPEFRTDDSIGLCRDCLILDRKMLEHDQTDAATIKNWP